MRALHHPGAIHQRCHDACTILTHSNYFRDLSHIGRDNGFTAGESLQNNERKRLTNEIGRSRSMSATSR